MKCRFLRWEPSLLSARKKIAPEKNRARKNLASEKKSRAKKFRKKNLIFSLDIWL